MASYCVKINGAVECIVAIILYVVVSLPKLFSLHGPINSMTLQEKTAPSSHTHINFVDLYQFLCSHSIGYCLMAVV